MKLIRIFFNLILIIKLLVPMQSIHAATTWIVTSHADGTIAAPGNCPHPTNCRLRDAIAASTNGDDIIFDSSLSSGIINLASTLTLSKDVTINGSALASPITISGDTDNNGSGDVRVFYVEYGVTATLNGLIITKGTDSFGGGGIYNYLGTLTIINSTFSGNSATVSGGGIYNYLGTLNVDKSSFSSNSAQYGGSIYNGEISNITNSTFTGNSANNGGAVYNSGTLIVTASTFSDNSASSYNGGGIYNGEILTITNSTFADNFANYGGGITNIDTLTITNSTFSGNSAATNGGSIGNWGQLQYANTIIANSSTGGDCVNFGTISTNTNNLVEDGSCSTESTNFKSGDPALQPLAYNGGFTKTFALKTDSSAIDAGNSTVCATAPVNGLDQRGTPRPQGAHCDIGAFEIAYTFADVVPDGFAWAQIESIYTAGITGGCSTNPLNYCPNNSVTRAQMAVFLLRGIHGSAYSPPIATGTVFTDVPSDAFAAAWIEQMVAEGITSGCGNGNYCPNSTVTRAQMAVFLLRAKYGSTYSPPVATGTVFTDVPSNGFAAAFIEQLVSEGITSGCGGGNYCPNSSVTRAQMAVFLQRTFNLPLQ